MSKILEDMCNEAASAAALAAREKIAGKLLRNGKMTLEEIAEVSELSVQEVQALTAKKGA